MATVARAKKQRLLAPSKDPTWLSIRAQHVCCRPQNLWYRCKNTTEEIPPSFLLFLLFWSCQHPRGKTKLRRVSNTSELLTYFRWSFTILLLGIRSYLNVQDPRRKVPDQLARKPLLHVPTLRFDIGLHCRLLTLEKRLQNQTFVVPHLFVGKMLDRYQTFIQLSLLDIQVVANVRQQRSNVKPPTKVSVCCCFMLKNRILHAQKIGYYLRRAASNRNCMSVLLLWKKVD